MGDVDDGSSVDADIERAFSLGQTSGAASKADGGFLDADPNIERAFLLGQTSGDVAGKRAFSLGHTPLQDGDDLVIANALGAGFALGSEESKRAFSLGHTPLQDG